MRCFVCDSTKTPIQMFLSKDRMYERLGVFQVRRCIECGLLSFSPRISRSKLSVHYPSSSYYSYTDNGDSVFRKLRTYLVKRFYYPTLFSKILFTFVNVVPAIPRMRKHGKIMDVGCGNGETIRSLKTFGWDTYGVDIDGAAIARGRMSGLSLLKRGTYEYLATFPDHYFDVIRSYHVIEHLDNPKKYVALAYRKLKKGGEFITGTPNAMSIHARLFRSFWYNLDVPRHQYIFSPDNLRKLIQRAHFSVTDIQYCSGGGFLGSIQYVFSSLFGRHFNWINTPFLFFLFYPFDWVSDKMHQGDVFVITARK